MFIVAALPILKSVHDTDDVLGILVNPVPKLPLGLTNCPQDELTPQDHIISIHLVPSEL